MYLPKLMHRCPEDGLLYANKKLNIDKDNIIIEIRKVIPLFSLVQDLDV